MQTSSYNRDICSVMKDCNTSKGIHNVTDEEPPSQQFAAVNMNRIAYHTSSSVSNALHNLNSLKSSIGYYYRQDSREPSRSNTISSTPFSTSYQNMYDAESYGERKRVSEKIYFKKIIII